ncbi:MAG: ABC-F family ATP-binding cassette domain-containing protein, partial [Clostridia bacterium]|nr:ABC-F family ATP-binding cassette domain-containing protein [Clostridia bacterium]
MLITIDNLSKSFGQEEILKNVKLTVNEKCRYGLIGVNGAGKSTLLKIIMGTLSFEEGEVIKKPGLKIGYLEQNNGLERDSSIIIEMRKVFEDVYESEQKMRALELEMVEISDQDSDEYRRIASEYTRAQNFFDSRDGYNIDVKIKTILNGMGFGDRDMDTVISTLSGGEKTRLAIARLLLEEPELLILDEPTNHLDFKTLKWLEEYLVNYNGAILTVSHDRYFLDKIVTHIYEVERGRVYSYAGNYSKYLPQKAERRARQEKEYEMQQMQIAQLQTYVDKNIARASTSHSAKSRLKTLENMEII